MNESEISISVQSIVYHNDAISLRKSLSSIYNAKKVSSENGLELKINFVYGDASNTRTFSDSEVASIQSELSPLVDFEYVFFNENTGSAKGHNILSKNSESQYIMIMNPDVIVSPRFFLSILQPFSDKKVAMVEARQTPLEHQKEYDIKTLETEWATTACAVITSDVFKQLDGFDSQSFFLYCDDLDFSWRLRLAGYKIIYQPIAPVFHAKKLDSGGKWMPTNAEIYYSAFSSLMMAYKWSNPDRVAELLHIFNSNGGIFKQAVQEFEDRKRNNQLPKPIDPEHKIARFIGDYYSENRYTL